MFSFVSLSKNCYMKEKIIAYLEGPRVYREGVALYEAYGRNLMLKATFRRSSETELVKVTLYEELRKLAGLSETEFKNLKRKASTATTTTAAPVIEEKEKTDDNKTATPVTKKIIKFRERFPFLNSQECPDVLKILVADMFTAYDTYLEAFKQLTELGHDAELELSLSYAKTAVENYLEDRAIWEELEYYQANHVLLGNHPKVMEFQLAGSMAEKSELEVSNIRRNAASNVSKWKKKLEEADTDEDRDKAQAALAKWEATKAAAEAELENRKKN